ncbi:MAG TPA: hypothetical protein VG142_13680 [Trebonia sp.]|jgi:hypothetical protein|nr:hypothetical protein [Trebonia sp.]
MRLLASPRHLPQRVATGAFILNSGVGKLSADDEAAAQLQGFAAAAYPFLAKLKPRDFKRILAASEITLGAVLLLPVIPSAVAGAGLAAFSGGLMGMYARVPGLRKQGSVQPTQEGIPLAQDIWLMGIALGLVVDDLIDNWSSRGDTRSGLAHLFGTCPRSAT